MKSKASYRLLATHSLVAAIFVNPYILLLFADLYRLLVETSNTDVVNVDTSFIAVMSLLSFAALTVSLVAFSIGTTPKKRLAVAISVGLIVAGWALSQVFAPLGFVVLAIAAAIIVFSVVPSGRR